MNKPSSHGCIRLSIDDAKWIFTNIPRESKVIIK
jgi:lipoprotein-anchoring transpeptidase ErfK/SrfK